MSYNFEPCILPTISGIELLMLTLVESFLTMLWSSA